MNAYNGKIIISHTEKIVFTYVLWNGAILSPGEQRSRDVAKYPTRNKTCLHNKKLSGQNIMIVKAKKLDVTSLHKATCLLFLIRVAAITWCFKTIFYCVTWKLNE